MPHPLPDTCVVGLEHEFGVVVEPSDVVGPLVTPGGAVMRLGGFGDPVTSPGQYLENGARFYLDCGDHPEYATPECSSAQELLAADCAGLALMAGMAERAETVLSERAGHPVRVRLLRNNVAPNATTWGTHENYLVPARLTWSDIALPLASHLASRPCFAGAGTVIPAIPQQRSGRFRISQRAPYVGGVVASSTLTVPVGKPMVMARDEPLADPHRFRRLQVVCGDATLAHTASLLKVGTTAVALRLVQDGVAPAVQLDDPVAALQAYSADPTLSVSARSDQGGLRATELQRLWLAAAWRHHERGGLTPAEAAVLEPWDEVLGALERDPAEAADRVDWVAKLAVLERLVERDGLAWDDPRVIAADLAYHDVRPERSIYGRLVAAGRMRTLVDADTVTRLRTHPPATTRALTRGTLIRLIRRCGYHYEVNWTTCQFNAGAVRVEVQLDDPRASRTPDADDAIAGLRRALAGGLRAVDRSTQAAQAGHSEYTEPAVDADGEVDQPGQSNRPDQADQADQVPTFAGCWASVAG